MMSLAIFPTFPGSFGPVQSSHSSDKLYTRWGSWAYVGGCCSKERDWGRWVVWRGGWREWEYLRDSSMAAFCARLWGEGIAMAFHSFTYSLTGNFSGLLFRSKPFPGVMLSFDTPFKNAIRKTEVPSWDTFQLHPVWEPTNGYTSPGIYFHSEQGILWVSTQEFHATGTH